MYFCNRSTPYGCVTVCSGHQRTQRLEVGDPSFMLRLLPVVVWLDANPIRRHDGAPQEMRAGHTAQLAVSLGINLIRGTSRLALQSTYRNYNTPLGSCA